MRFWVVVLAVVVGTWGYMLSLAIVQTVLGWLTGGRRRPRRLSYRYPESRTAKQTEWEYRQRMGK